MREVTAAMPQADDDGQSFLVRAKGDPEYQARIDAERCTWQLKDAIRPQGPQEDLEELPLFSGEKRQRDLF